MTITTNDFNKITSLPVGMGAERIEYENLLAFMLNKLIDDEKEITAPVGLIHSHPEMVKKGYLKKTDEGYCLTPKSIGILHNFCGKNK